MEVIHKYQAPDGWENSPNYTNIGSDSAWKHPLPYTQANHMSGDKWLSRYLSNLMNRIDKNSELSFSLYQIRDNILVCDCPYPNIECCHGSVLVDVINEICGSIYFAQQEIYNQAIEQISLRDKKIKELRKEESIRFQLAIDKSITILEDYANATFVSEGLLTVVQEDKDFGFHAFQRWADLYMKPALKFSRKVDSI